MNTSQHFSLAAFQRTLLKPLTTFLVLFAMLLGVQPAIANIVAPYASDANTLLLFHLDEASSASSSNTVNVSTAFGVTNNAYTLNVNASAAGVAVTTVLGSSGFSGFGNAANLNLANYVIGWDANNSGVYQGDNAVDRITMSQLNMGNGGQTPWTIEAMIYPSVINQNQEIICTDSSAAARAFQFKITSAGQLLLDFIGGTPTPVDATAAIPTTGSHAFVANNWYHVAAVYNGTSITLYWTRVLPGVPSANALVTTASAVGTGFGAVTGSFNIGNENRAAGSEYFRGLIDEVRISNIARAANGGMLFSSLGGPAVQPTVITPANNPIYAGSTVTMTAAFTGTAPFSSFVWQSDGSSAGTTWTNLPGSTTNTFALNTTSLTAGTYQFRLVVTDAAGTYTNQPASIVLANASGPLRTADTVISPAVVALGSTATMTAAFDGTQPISYQWQYATDAGGTGLVNISGATSATFALTNVQNVNVGFYRLSASNTVGGGTISNSSFVALVTKLPVVLADFGTTDPAVGANDIAQLSIDGNVGNPGVGYYTDNTPGQTFTTGSDPSGYSLSSLYIKYRTLADGAHVAGNPWTLRLYSLTNAALGNAVLIGTYTNDNSAPVINTARWLKWYGPITNILSPNTSYAYMIQARGAVAGGAGFLQVGNASNSPSFYSGGRLVSIPAAGGAMALGNAGTANFDATFMVNLVPAGYPAVQNISSTPTNGSTIFAGAPVTLNVTAIGTGIGYIWQTDNGSGGVSFSNLPSSNTNSYNLNTSGLASGNTYQFRVMVTNSFDTNISSTVSLTVLAAVIQNISIAPVNNSSNNPVYVGTPVTLSATVQGNNLYYIWRENSVDIPASNTNQYTFSTSAMTPGTYTYDLLVTNNSGQVVSAQQLTLNLVAASGPVLLTGTTLNPSVVIVGNNVQMSATFTGSQPITYQWQHAGTNLPGATGNSLTITGVQVAHAGAYSLLASNNPPGIGASTANSTVANLYVVAAPQTNITLATLVDGGVTPFVGAYDVSQLLFDAGAIAPGSGNINYYVDNAAPPGQIFKTGTTPPTVAGYPLNYVYLKHENNNDGTGYSTAQTYTLRLYEMMDATNAALITSYVTTNLATFTAGNWVRVAGMTNMLKTNTSYAFSLQRNTSGWWKLAAHVSVADDYADGDAVTVPALGGAVAHSSPDAFTFYNDAAFVAGMTPPSAPIELVATTINNSSVYSGQGPVTMTASFAGSNPISYRWQHEGTNIPGATNTIFTIPIAAFARAGTYVCLASNSVSTPTNVPSTPVVLTVLTPPTSLVANYAYSTTTPYSGLGVIGTGSFWNQCNGTSVNLTSLAEDGATPAGFGFAATATGTFANLASPIELYKRYLLLQGDSIQTFGFSNLMPGIYNLVLYSCNGNYQGSRTSFVINGVTNTAVTTTDASFIQGNNFVRFNNIVVSNGVINGTWFRPSAEGALNGAQLQMAVSFDNPQIFVAIQPASQTNLTGSLVTLSVLGEAPGQVFYQWRSNGVPVVNATNTTYTAYTGVAGVWSYDVIVTNSTGLTPVTSDTAILTVVDPNPLVWRGYTADWDLVSGNWSNLVTSADNVIFMATDAVFFDDTATSFNPVLTGTLLPSAVTVNNTANNYVMSGTGIIGGSTSLTKNGNGTLILTNGNNTYSGGTTVNGGVLALVKGNSGTSTIRGALNINPGGTVALNTGDALGYTVGVSVSPVNIVGGTLTNSGGNQGFNATFNLMGGTMAGVGNYNFNGASSAINSLATNIVSTITANVALRANGLAISTAQGTVPGGIDLNIAGVINDSGGNTLTKNGNGTLALSGVCTFNGDITINAGSLRMEGAGRLNNGNYTAHMFNNGTDFTYNSAAAQTMGVISGTGALKVNGSGTLTLNSVNDYTGATTVNAGTLAGAGTIAGVVTNNSGGTIAPGSGGVGTLTINNNLVLKPGSTSLFEVNGSTLAKDMLAVSGSVTYGGTLQIVPSGTFVANQTFALFSGVGTTNSSNFSSIAGSPGSGLGFTFTNGTLRVVTTVNINPTNITTVVSGNQMTLSWPADYTGWRLQTQTNAPGVGLTGTWVDIVGSTSTNQVTIPVNPANGSVFFRMIYP